MTTLVRVALLTLLTSAAACGDDDGSPGDGGTEADAGAESDAGAEPDGGGEPDAGVAQGCPGEVEPAQLVEGAWDDRLTIAGFTGHDGPAPAVFDFDRDVDGSTVAVGHFQWIGSQRVEPLVRWTGERWEPARTRWELTPPPSGFAAVAIADDGDLALATFQSSPPGTPRQGEIWVDDGSGLRVVGQFEGLVRSLEWFDGQLWAAGAFSMAGNLLGVAVWNGEAWATPPGGPSNGIAFELEAAGGVLLVGGSFTSIGGVDTRLVASYDGRGWKPLDLDIEPATAVFALALGDDGRVYAGGSFGKFEAGSGAIARRDATGWTMLGGGVAFYALPGVVSDLLAVDGSLYVTGCFNAVGGPAGGPDSIETRSLARWDGDAWVALNDESLPIFTPWHEELVCGDEAPFALWDAPFQTLAADGGRVLVGGNFPGVDGVQSQSIIARQDEKWVAQGAAGLGLGGPVERVVAGGPECTVHAFGRFSHASGEPVSASLLRFEGDRWVPEAERLPLEFFCPSLAVSDGGEVVTGCIAPPPEGGEGGGGAVLRLGDAGWERIAAADSLGPVFAVDFDAAGRLWMGGVGETGYVARLDGDELEVVEDGFDLAVIHLDAAGEDDVLVAGDFTAVGDLPAQRIARWDGSSWSALGEGLAATVTAIGRDGDRVYASTLESGGGGGLLFGLYDGEKWTELATPETGLTADRFFSFSAIRPLGGGKMVAAGTASLDCADFPCPSDSERGALVWDGARFSGLGGGVRAIGIADLAIGRDAIWFGGPIAEAGSGDDLVPTVSAARYALPAR
jgi:hypothetical protein